MTFVHVSHCTSHRQKGQFTGQTVQKIATLALIYSGQQRAKQLVLLEDIGGVIVTEGVESVLGFYTFTSLVREPISNLTSFLNS